MEEWGRVVIVIGGLVLIYGIFLMKGVNPLSWMGNLPGDIHIQKENVSIYIPITTMIILSIVFTVILYFLRK